MKISPALMCLVMLLLLLPPAVSAVGNISVTSNPAGATVFLDGISVGAVTPYTITNVANATHTIVLKLSGYQDYTQASIQVNDNQTSVVSAPLVAVISSPAISSISPNSGYNSSAINNVVIAGSGFATSGTVVRLYKSGQTNITGLVTSAAAGQLTCNFPITGNMAGTWDMVVINPDGGTVTYSSGFTIVDASAVATITGITPSSGTTNTTVTITSLAGTGFQSTAQIRLTRTGYNDLIGSVSSFGSTSLAGTFDLTNEAPGTWTACVLYDGTNRVCGPVFTIYATTSAVNGSIFCESNPSGSSLYLDNVLEGTTTLTLYNVTPGDHRILMEESGYQSYSSTVTVTPGNQTSVYGRLNEVTVATATTATPVITTYTPVPTVKKTTKPTPTPWPTDTPTPASPVGPLVIIGAVGIACCLMRR
jgi:PEGA domain